MEELHYGNWIRRKVLWMWGLTSLVLGILALSPLPLGIRIAFGILGGAALISFLFPLYLYFVFSHRGGDLQSKFYTLILDHLESNEHARVLDIGTGNGILAIKAALRNPHAEVTGVDTWGRDWEYSKSVCEQNARLAGVADRLHFQKGSAAAVDFPDGAFDVVISNLTFHEVRLVKRKIDVLREALRLLKPGGSYAFIDYFYDERYYGDASGFELLLWSLKMQNVELKRLEDVMVLPKLLRHPRALGKIGIVYGKK